MHPQLEAIVRELEEASERLERLAGELPDDLWGTRPETDRWSASECVAHLNLTSRAFLPTLRSRLADARESGAAAPRRYRRDPLGWLLWRTMGPPVRLRVKTSAAFVPASAEPPGRLRSEFQSLQSELMDLVRDSERLPLQKVKIRSPFDARAKYNVFAALSILPRHQHRHLWQAEQVAQKLAQTSRNFS